MAWILVVGGANRRICLAIEIRGPGPRPGKHNTSWDQEQGRADKEVAEPNR